MTSEMRQQHRPRCGHRFGTWTILATLAICFGFCAGTASAEKAHNAESKTSTKSLVLLAKDKLPAIDRVVIKGENPELVYIPITHDGPYNHLSSNGTEDVRTILDHGKAIAQLLYDEYGVRNILLEGLPKTFADTYNKIDLKKKRINTKNTKMVVYKTWYDLLNSRRWTLAPARDKKHNGALTVLGNKYDRLIFQTIDKAKRDGWFRNRDVFLENQTAFMESLKKIANEYNEKRAAVLKDDPGLKKEYAITVTLRNKEFLDNIQAEEGPGIILCGAGHVQDLEQQLAKRGTSYIIVVPKGIAWPPKKKDDARIYSDMLKLGCKLKQCTIHLGDGGSAKIALPIE